MSHLIPASSQLAYRQYVSDAQKAHDENAGFVPIDCVIFTPASRAVATVVIAVTC